MTFRNTLFAGLVGIIASCGSDGKDAGCTSDSDCKDGRVCDTDTGDCAPPPCTDIGVTCNDNNVYKIDSCGTIKDLVEDCGNKPCEGGSCVDEPCRPQSYVNSCEGTSLRYCDVDESKIRILDCPKEGFSHCGRVEVYDKSICYGDGKYGDPCPSGDGISATHPAFVKSECNYDIVDFCVEDSSRSYCTITCNIDSDCVPERASCFVGVCLL
jgi:hypothetical protein